MGEETKNNNEAGWTYQVIIDPSFTNGNFGHAIIQIESPAGEKLAAGFYPKRSPDSTNLPDFTGTHHAVESPGHVRYENVEVTYSEYTFKSRPRSISEDTAQKMIGYITERVDNPGRYELWNHNCVEFVEGAMEIAGDGGMVENALVPIMLKQKIEIQEATEDILKKTKKEVCNDNPEDWGVVTNLYTAMKKTICEVGAESAETAAGVGKLTESFAKEIDVHGLHELAKKIQESEITSGQDSNVAERIR